MTDNSVLKEQGKWHARKITAILLAAVLCILPVGMAFAESVDDGSETEDADITYAGYLGRAVDATAIYHCL